MDIGSMVAIAMGAFGAAAGSIAWYVKMSLPAFTIKTLNGRYPTSEVVNARFDGLHTEVSAIKELLVNRLNDLPCKAGDCPRKTTGL